MTSPSSSRAVVLIGHGSRHPTGVGQFLTLAGEVQQRLPGIKCYPGFLELARPTILQAVRQAVREGAQHIDFMPVLLLSAGHAKNDIPVLCRAALAGMPGISGRYLRPLGISAELLRLAEAALRAVVSPDEISRTHLVVIGRGTSDPEANADAAKLARWLEEGLGFAESSVAFFAMTRPRLDEGLDRAARRSDGRVAVLPLLLFGGKLEETTARALAAAETRNHGVRFSLAAPLCHQQSLADLLTTRLEQAATEGDEVEMPCLSCKYRGPVPGHEDEAGAPQELLEHGHVHPAGLVQGKKALRQLLTSAPSPENPGASSRKL